jgi:uncharacterized protein (TIRG00374 family)
MRATLAGDFGGSITPARSGTEPARYLVLSGAGVATTSAILILYMELFLEMISLAAVVIIALLVLGASATLAGALITMVVLYTAVIGGVAVLAVWLARRPLRSAPPGWAAVIRLTPPRWAVIERWFSRVRNSVMQLRGISRGWTAASFIASCVHISMRLCVLPALVLGAGSDAPLSELALWPLALLYGATIVPAPGGAGAVELGFNFALRGVIDPRYLAGSLLWWRFYTFYIYIVLGGIAAGGTVLKAIRKTEELEEELVGTA